MRYYNLFEGGQALRIAIGITVLGLLLAGAAGAATLTVDDSGGANYTRIQDAIDNASNGDTIAVAAGTYNENVNVYKSVSLIGSGAEITILKAANTNIHGFNISVDYVNISDFTVKGTTKGPPDWNSAGIYLYRANYSNISSNILLNNNDGIEICWYSTHNTLFNNIIDSNGNGIELYSQSNNNTVTNNILRHNDVGIYLLGAFYNTISNNTIYSNNGGISFDKNPEGGPSDNTVIDNNVSNNNQGVFLGSMSYRNLLSRNTISNNSLDGISICSASDNIISTNIVSNNEIGIRLCIQMWINSDPIESINNTIYDNIFFNRNDFISEIYSLNNWSSKKIAGTNIIGGSYLGGNIWAHPNGTGFSQTCSDNDKDGICDSAYTLDSDNTDYLPLAVIAEPLTGAPNINDFSPPTTTVTNNVGDSRTFSITTNQIVKISWLINETEVFNETGVLTSSYTNSSAALGTWNVTAVASNANYTSIQNWVWIVTPVLPSGSNPMYSFDFDVEGWFGEPEEPIYTNYNSNGPFDGGALVASFPFPRDNVVLEHTLDPRWSSLENAYSKVTLDVEVSNSNNIKNIAYRIKDETQEALYIVSTISPLGNNRYHVELVPADPSLGPFGGRDRVGLNLDISFEPMLTGSITIDNIEGIECIAECTPPPPVPEMPTIALMGIGLFGLMFLLQRRKGA